MPVKFIFILFSFFISQVSLAGEKWIEGYFLVNGCKIYGIGGFQLRTFPGDRCLFFENGDFISSTATHTRYISKDNEVKWVVPGLYHHQTTLSADGKRILALVSKMVIKSGKNIRVDKFQIISIHGVVLFEQTSDELHRQAKKPDLDWKPPGANSADIEISHFNSFYEIPELLNKNVPAYLKSGNFVVNGTESGVFFLSPDLKTVLHHMDVKESQANHLHDVQVLSNGNLLFFNNWTGGYPIYKRFSSIQEMDLNSMKLVLNFTAKPLGMFYSHICGGVQRLTDDMVLFSHVFNGTYVYSQSKDEIVLNVSGTNIDGDRLVPAQQVKALKLDKFLSHWN